MLLLLLLLFLRITFKQWHDRHCELTNSSNWRKKKNIQGFNGIRTWLNNLWPHYFNGERGKHSAGPVSPRNGPKNSLRGDVSCFLPREAKKTAEVNMQVTKEALFFKYHIVCVHLKAPPSSTFIQKKSQMERHGCTQDVDVWHHFFLLVIKLTSAHFMSQTSFLSNFRCSPTTVSFLEGSVFLASCED